MIKNYSFDVAHINAKLFVSLTLFFHPAPVWPILFKPVFAFISFKKIFEKLYLKRLSLLNFQQKEGSYSVYWLYLLTEELIWICIENPHLTRFDSTTSGRKHGPSDTSSLLKNMTEKNCSHKTILQFTKQ